MTDTDPENKVRDVPRPADGLVVAPHADTGEDGVENRQDSPAGQRAGHRDRGVLV